MYDVQCLIYVVWCLKYDAGYTLSDVRYLL